MATPPPLAPLHLDALPPPSAVALEDLPASASTFDPPLSKNQQKKLLRKQAYEREKPERRARERAAKKDKAAEKRKLVELGVIERPVDKRRAKNGPKTPYGARIVIDVGFDDKMTDKEIKSMSSQLGFCYATNRSTPNPVPFLITSLSGRLKNHLEVVGHRTNESWRGVEWWEEGYEELWVGEGEAKAEASGEGKEVEAASVAVPEIALGNLKGKLRARCKREDVIYLTADSPNVLTELDEGKSYILGGIVDRNRYKLLCYDKANADGIQHAQLPISQFLPEMTTRKILTVNQVFEIMVKWVELRDWKEALRAVMPQRKYSNAPRVRGKKNKAAAEGGEGEEEGDWGEEGEDEGDWGEGEGGEDMSYEDAGEGVEGGAESAAEGVEAKGIEEAEAKVAV